MVDTEIVAKTCGIAIAIGEVYCEQRADEGKFSISPIYANT